MPRDSRRCKIYPSIHTRPVPDLKVPELYDRLPEIAYNLWWTWSPLAHRLFDRLAPATWKHYRNPIDVLIDMSPEDWRRLEADRDFSRDYHALVADFDAYVRPIEPTWFARSHPDYDGGPFAYFSTEYGWHECLPVYSGGLGVLSGDHCKAASDIDLPMVGVGLMYRLGYFRQTIDAEGFQQHLYPEYDLHRLPLRPVVDESGMELHVPVEFPDRTVSVRIWRALVGRISVLLMDSDLPINHEADRPITSILYVGDREMRLCQEILLGMGGVRVLEALGIQPAAWHLNEGHSALLSLQRVGDAVQREGLTFDEARGRIAASTMFTTHTPVPAGNETFAAPLVRGFFNTFFESTGLDADGMMALGRAADDPEGEGFNLTALALRTSARANGVSELHGRVADDMWKPVLEGEGLPGIEHVTNGIHVPSWIGPEMVHLLHAHLGSALDAPEPSPEFAEAVHAVPGHELWTAHLAQKRRLIGLAREKTLEQFARHGRPPSELRRLQDLLDPSALTIGFARRFATYKRADLLLRDEQRLRDLVADDERPVQLIFSGKAHPADRPGQDLIRRIWQSTLSPELRRRVIFIENYDMRIARHLVQGVDLWLNTPRRPHEASGTSGMKAAVNGVLNCSILDGWWCEGYDASHGWAIGNGESHATEEEQDNADMDSLFGVLRDQVVPAFYEQDEQGLPADWIRRMKAAIASLAIRFSAARMVREYAEKYYLPAAKGELTPTRTS